jgi:signal transduction histidine kinase/CheY-like chemotaxis protein/HAMP domain-containing protein
MFKLKTFSSSLTLNFLLATIVPLICLGYFSYSYLEFKINQASKRSNELLAETVANEISFQLRLPEIVLRQTGIILNSQGSSDQKTNRLLNTVVSESSFLEGIYVLDENKHIAYLGLEEQFVKVAETFLDLDLSRLSILKNIELLFESQWSQSFRSPVSGKKSIALKYPFGTRKYLLGIVNIEDLHDTISTLSKRRKNLILVLDDGGNIIFHPQLRLAEQQQNFANIQPFKSAQLGIFGEAEFNLGSTSYIGGTANIASANWLVIVAQPLVEARKPLRNLADAYLFAAFISITILLSLAYRLSKRLLHPLNELQKNIKKVADGDYHANVAEQQHEEFEKVAHLFRRMSDSIARREQLLELNEERLVALLDIHDLKGLEEDELLEFALEQAVKLTRSEIGYIHILDDKESVVKSTLWSRNTDDFCARYGITETALAYLGLGQKSLAKREPIFKNISQDSKDSLTVVELTVKRQLSNPIFDNEKMVAVVGVINKRTDYDSTDARQLSLYFNHTWDIIQQKRYDRDRSRLGEQLAQAQKLEAIGTLAGGIAHDFNNVLMVIIGNTELARDNIDRPELIKNDLDEIFKAGLRARDLVNQILAFSRDQAEGRKPMDIKPLVKEAVKLLRSSIPANVKIHQRIATESLPVVTEPGQINQLIMNLCTNAYQALEGKAGELEIQLEPIVLKEALFDKERLVAQAGEYMQLVIRDNGKGIPEDKINRIFEPYYTTREKERGTGLGLAVVHGIVKGMKGTIVVESKPEVGTAFFIYLPTASVADQAESNVLAANLPGGEEHILYVDDDVKVAKTNSKLLENLGYTVTTFYSSSEALEDFKQQPNRYDLVISDFDMPEMTGDVLATNIIQINNKIPVILCTGYSEQIDKKKAEAIGVSELIFKPITKVDLALTVRKILGFSR